MRVDFPIGAFAPQAGTVRKTGRRVGWIAACTIAAGLAMTIGPVVAASGAVVGHLAACAQPARQESIPAPTGAPWYAARLGRDHVAGLSLGDGQVVAVLDTGVAPVPALAGALRPTIDLLPAAGAPTSTAQDCDGRGTVMAGLVAARRGSAVGTGMELPGLARAADILPVRVLASARDTVDPEVLARGMTRAVAAGASVVLVGSAVRDDPALQAATQAALAAGIPVVAAAGDGDDRALAFPAAYDGVIAVAATGTQDAASAVNAVGRVSVGAPGTDIVGLGLDGGVVGGQAGSALAAALVAATVADVRAAYPDLGPAQLIDRIRATADRPGVAIPDPALGWGVVNPVTALTAPVDSNVPPVSRPAVSPSPSTTNSASTNSASSAIAPTIPGAVTVVLPPEPADNSWAIVIAAMMLVLAAVAVAVVAGVRQARARKWRPAARPAEVIGNSAGNRLPQSPGGP